MLAREANSYNVLGRYSFYRPMDKMEISVKSPNEDEFALAIMTQMSPYMGGCFYRDNDQYDKYLSFEEASQSDRLTWSNALQFLCKKLLYRNPDKTLVLKSPSHTARIEILKSIWPSTSYIFLFFDSKMRNSSTSAEIRMKCMPLLRTFTINFNLIGDFSEMIQIQAIGL